MSTFPHLEPRSTSSPPFFPEIITPQSEVLCKLLSPVRNTAPSVFNFNCTFTAGAATALQLQVLTSEAVKAAMTMNFSLLHSLHSDSVSASELQQSLLFTGCFFNLSVPLGLIFNFFLSLLCHTVTCWPHCVSTVSRLL